MEHLNIVVTGKVQRVWFRQSTLDKAIELGVNGYTMNLPSGDVYIEAEAESSVLDKFVDWCRVGPELSNVEDVSLTKSKHKGFKSFQIVK
jgi:acylphosphatase